MDNFELRALRPAETAEMEALLAREDVYKRQVPASAEVLRECMRSGVLEILSAAGATVTTPGCGACLGAHEGVLAPQEACITSTNPVSYTHLLDTACLLAGSLPRHVFEKPEK